MSIRNCPECGRLYLDTGSDLCPECVREEDRQFDLVKEYLEEHPNAVVDEVSEMTGVAKERIVKFLRVGRLTQGSVQGFVLRCEVCGAVIETGRLCRRCMSGFEDAASPASRKRDPVRQGFQRMHTYEVIKKDKE